MKTVSKYDGKLLLYVEIDYCLYMNLLKLIESGATNEWRRFSKAH